MRSFQGLQAVEKFIDCEVSEALADVHRECEQLGYEAQLVRGDDVATSMTTWALLVDIAGERRFQYLVAPVECVIPMLGERHVQQGDKYYRVEAFNRIPPVAELAVFEDSDSGQINKGH